jgi:hypothetical protein
MKAQKSDCEILRAIKEKILQSLSSTEKAPGYIYGFRRDPNEDYVKIGVTTRQYLVRIREWARQCRQSPKVVFAIYMPCAGRMEKLLQLCLHNERRLETLVDGLCNSGKGCPQQHQEWFRVPSARARDVVSALALWAKCTPYSDDGGLAQTWRQRVKALQGASSPGDTWRELMGVDRMSHGEIKAEAKPEAKIKLERDAEVVLLPPCPVETSGSAAAATGIKQERGDEVTREIEGMEDSTLPKQRKERRPDRIVGVEVDIKDLCKPEKLQIRISYTADLLRHDRCVPPSVRIVVR